MKFLHNIIIMFIFSFLIQYYLMSFVSIDNISNFTNNYGKLYMSLLMGLYMVFIEVIMHDYHYNIFSINNYIFLIVSLGVIIYLYRNQVLINDRQYLKGMIEHHSMALLTSEEILKKTYDYNIAKLAKDIIQTQKDEINKMKSLL